MKAAYFIQKTLESINLSKPDRYREYESFGKFIAEYEDQKTIRGHGDNIEDARLSLFYAIFRDGLGFQDSVLVTHNNLTVKALEAYLSAGTKQSRKEASVLAKQAYKELTGKDYENPKS